MSRSRRIKVVFEELGDNPPTTRNSTNFGELDIKTGVVSVDPRQPPSEMLDTFVHEFLHVAFPNMPENEVARAATLIADNLWLQGYRRK
jgi:hypothetical protein